MRVSVFLFVSLSVCMSFETRRRKRKRKLVFREMVQRRKWTGGGRRLSVFICGIGLEGRLKTQRAKYWPSMAVDVPREASRSWEIELHRRTPGGGPFIVGEISGHAACEPVYCIYIYIIYIIYIIIHTCSTYICFVYLYCYDYYYREISPIVHITSA